MNPIYLTMTSHPGLRSNTGCTYLCLTAVSPRLKNLEGTVCGPVKFEMEQPSDGDDGRRSVAPAVDYSGFRDKASTAAGWAFGVPTANGPNLPGASWSLWILEHRASGSAKEIHGPQDRRMSRREEGGTNRTANRPPSVSYPPISPRLDVLHVSSSSIASS